VLGALDMGGSSTQIVFQPTPNHDVEQQPQPQPLVDSDFFVHSYLNYGVDRIRERLWAKLLSQSEARGEETPTPNPCSFHGRIDEWSGRQLVGVGDAVECEAALKSLIFPDCSSELHSEEGNLGRAGTGCGVDSVRHPPLSGGFVAMSVYFFALDCMRVLIEASEGASDALPDWPAPSIRDLTQVSKRFCDMDWSDVEGKYGALHDWSYAEQLPGRCFEVVYITSLLQYGFGFDPDSRDITYALDVDGMEVEWTLGYALSHLADGGEPYVG